MNKKILSLFLLLTICSCDDRWQKLDDCNLISKHFKGSTEKSNIAPTINTSGKLGVGLVTTGEGEQHITIWECDHLGTITSTDYEIFRKAKGKHTLMLAESFLQGLYIKSIIK